MERIYTMGPCRIHYIDNSRKVAPNFTSTAPIATGHWTFIFIKGEQELVAIGAVEVRLGATFRELSI